jgi:hypothetical protein
VWCFQSDLPEKKMKIKQTCCYRGHNYNLLPAILVTPKVDGFIVALKWWNLHVGVYFTTERKLQAIEDQRRQKWLLQARFDMVDLLTQM